MNRKYAIVFGKIILSLQNRAGVGAKISAAAKPLSQP
jgi:hypothetical protein